MRTIFRTFAIALIGAVTVCMTACNDKVSEDLITISTNALTFDAAGDTKPVTITAKNWNVTPSDTWIEIVETDNGIEVTVGATTQERSGTITVDNEDDSKTITVTQSAPSAPDLTVSTESLSFVASGGSESVTVTSVSSQIWNATPSHPWIEITEITSGIEVLVGTATEERSGTITIATADESVTITVTQDGPHPVFGIISFRTDNTWIVEKGDITQEWSDVVMVSNARGKTTYNGGNLDGNNNVDFCENGSYYDLFSWGAVNQYKDDLCPGDWRVPTKDDFVALDMAFDGDGQNRYVDSDDYYTNTFTNPDVWGGEMGGRIEGTDTFFLMGQMWWGHYWSQTSEYNGSGNAYHLSLGLGAWYIGPQEIAFKANGFAVRCVK